MTAPPVTLAAYTDAELATFYGTSGDQSWQATLEAEMERRDRAAASRQARRADPVAADWTMAAHAQYLDAERACNGNLVRRGSPVTDAWQLWSGPERYALAHATEELRNYWLTHPRMTVTAYQRQAAAGRTAEREARHEAVVTDDARQVRRQAAGSAGGHAPVDAVRAGSEQDRRPSRDAGHARATGSGGTGMIGHIIGEGMRAAASTQRNTRGYGTTPQPAGREAMRSQLQARADETRRRKDVSKALAEDPDLAEAFGTGGTASPATATVALRGTAAVSRQREQADLIAAESIRYAERILTRHVAWPTRQALDTVLLWCLHASARDRDETGTGPLIWRASPRLLVTSKERGAGKSTALDLIAMLAGSRFGRMPRVTAPAFAKIMSKFQETAVLDEARVIFGSGSKSADLQGMLLAGYTPRAHSVTAHAGGTADKLFGAVALGGKDNLITTASDSVSDLLDRCLIVRMKRASRHYPDIDEAAERAADLACQGMGTWASMLRTDLIAASQRLSREASESGELDMDDVDSGALRAAQIWRPLLAVADVLGGDWPDRARIAAAAGSTEADEWLAEIGELDSVLFGGEAQPQSWEEAGLSD